MVFSSVRVVAVSLALVLGSVWSVQGQENQEEGNHEGHEHILDVNKENMQKIAKSLGVRCNHCHIVQMPNGRPDFEAPSHLKATAIQMHVDYVDGLKTADGGALECVTCHNEATQFLPRDISEAQPTSIVESGAPRKEIVQKMRQMQNAIGAENCEFCHIRNEAGRLDPTQPTKYKQIAKFMMEHYTGKLTKDGEPVTCETCHQGKPEFLPRSAAMEEHEGDDSEKEGGGDGGE